MAPITISPSLSIISIVNALPPCDCTSKGGERRDNFAADTISAQLQHFELKLCGVV